MKRIALICMLASICLGGICPVHSLAAEDPSVGLDQSQSPDALAIQEGKGLLALGNQEEALNSLRSFVVRFPDSPYLPQAYLLLAKILQERGEPEHSLLYLNRIPENERGPEAQLIEGADLVVSGQPEKGLDLLMGVDPAGLSATDKVKRLKALAEGNALLDKPLEALVFIHQAIQTAPGEKAEALLAMAHTQLRDRMSDASLEEAAFMFREGPIGLDASLQIAVRAFQRGDVERAQNLLDSVVKSPLEFPYRGEAITLLDRITGKPWLQRAVGVVLPLSGRYGEFGNLVRKGMELAAKIYNESHPAVPFIFRDGGSDPDLTAKEVRFLARQERVMAIAGPLTGVASAAAANAAEAEKVPLMAISQKEGLAQTGPYIFRDSLTGELQVEALARYAVVEKGLTGFAVLYPENRQGREMAEQFAKAVEARDGVVVKMQSYPAEGTDFRRSIKELLGQDPDAPEESEEPPKTEEETPADALKQDKPQCSDVDFEALFIPDYADRVGLLVPQLAYYGVENVQLLGINGWNSPDLIKMAGNYVDGAVFVDGFFRYSPYPFVREFVNKYYEAYGEEPSILEAQGYDVANILLSVMEQPEVRTREDFIQGLLRVVNYPGVTGATSFDPDGEAEKVLFLLQVQNGNIVQIN